MSKKDQKINELEREISKLKSSVTELKVLNDIAMASGKAVDVDQILNLIVQKAISVIGAEQGSILLLTQNKDEPFKTIIRQDDSSSLKHNYHIGSNITGWVLFNKRPLIIEDLSNDKRFAPTEEEKKDIHSVLCVPIWYEGNIMGLMMLVNKKDKKTFLPNDLTLFSIISVQAGQLIKNLELQRENFRKIKEAEKLHELDEIKTLFFTNISHEFRTPLTLILGPAKEILKQSEDEEIKGKADIIHRSAKKLNRLTNQLLDISRIESGKMKLKANKQNLIPVIKDLVFSFQAFAERKQISLNFSPQKEEINLYIDRDKFDKILNNILSNAIKFTPQGGSVNVDVRNKSSINSRDYKDKDAVEISVIDTGIGIPKEQFNKIFDRFYQVDNRLSKEYEGTGIGLSLTKELVELHKGKINVESEEGKGSIFRVILLLGKDHLQPEEIVEDNFHEEIEVNLNKEIIQSFDDSNLIRKYNDKKNAAEVTANSNKPALLIIEDNSDVRKYIIDILENYYQITEAFNGEEGFSKSIEEIPDLIISDIMMPKLDGIQLCRKLKSDSRTSHIPLILLTAKATLKDKIEGLETGADEYIMKPFEESELKARIKNLLEQRKRLHNHFKRYGVLDAEEKHLTSIDQKFLHNAMDIINEHISDPCFGVETFANRLAVSRSLLYKKMICLTGESPVELIRRIRLNKAAKLIECNSGNITEISFEVGFNNPSYFTECFKNQFGISPTQYHQRYIEKRL